MPLSEEQARGVPAEQILSIRDASGDSVDAQMVTLLLHALPDGVDAAPYFEAYGFTPSSREVWLVSFASKDSAPPNEEL